MRAEDVGDVEVLQRHLRQGWAGRIVEVVVLVYQSFFSYSTSQHLLPYPSHTQNLLLAAVLPLAQLVTLAAVACIRSVYFVVAGYNGRAQLGEHSN